MKRGNLALLTVAVMAAMAIAPTLAEQAVRHLPARDIAVPDTVSPQMQALIGRPLQPTWNDHPKSAAEWKALVDKRANDVAATLPELRSRLGVTVQPTVIGGVKAFIVTPDEIAANNRNRLLIHVHGGGYVLFPGESGTREAILMAGYGRMKIISVDYRMPPDFPYPAAMDDAMAVWREVVKTSSRAPAIASDPRRLRMRWGAILPWPWRPSSACLIPSGPNRSRLSSCSLRAIGRARPWPRRSVRRSGRVRRSTSTRARSNSSTSCR